MATQNLTAGQVSATGTLSASTVDTINFSIFAPAVEIVSDGAALMYVTVDGTTPTVGGNNTYVLPASASTRTFRLGIGGRNPAIKLISAGTPTYWVSVAQKA